MTERIKQCDVVESCVDCPRYGDDCDGDKRIEHTDLISRADAIERIANDNVVGGMKRINEYRDSTEHNDYLDGISTAIATVEDIPSADEVMHEIRTETHGVCSDLISREDAIEAVCGGCVWYKTASCEEGKEEWECSEVNKIRHLPSAEAVQEAVPTVVRVTMSDGNQYYFEHERDAIQADTVSREFYEDAVKANIRIVMENRELKEQIESAEAEWIPCSERLPSEDGLYLVQTNYMYHGIPNMDVYYWADGWNCNRLLNGMVKREYEIDGIVAWIPLPKPYKGGDAE